MHTLTLARTLTLSFYPLPLSRWFLSQHGQHQLRRGGNSTPTPTPNPNPNPNPTPTPTPTPNPTRWGRSPPLSASSSCCSPSSSRSCSAASSYRCPRTWACSRPSRKPNPPLPLAPKVFYGFLLLWWAAGTGVLTFHGPYRTTGNPYFACWAALLSSVLLCADAFTKMKVGIELTLTLTPIPNPHPYP